MVHSSNASCDALFDGMMQSRGFTSQCVETKYISLGLNRYYDVILGLGHIFKNVEGFYNAIYLMSLGGSFQYKYMGNLLKHMSIKCSIKGCSWNITTHTIVGNEIL